MNDQALVITTINEPTLAVQALASGCLANHIQFIVAGDTKSPADFSVVGSRFVSVNEQVHLYPGLCAVLPTHHYTRKNIGYLVAMAEGATIIHETDDDNFPRDEFWQLADFEKKAEEFSCEPWANVYSLFSDRRIWPRGFPLEYVHGSSKLTSQGSVPCRGLIMQGLADGNPDVDAVYRLVYEMPINFARRPPVVLQPGSWCPFNSQNTVFRKEVFPLLYLPSKCSFRMTDIWRSFVAQRCLWEMGESVLFHSATVWQERNEHNLIHDFEDEVDGYLLNDKIRQTLERVTLNSRDAALNQRRCYVALVKDKYLPGEELDIIHQWSIALERLVK